MHSHQTNKLDWKADRFYEGLTCPPEALFCSTTDAELKLLNIECVLLGGSVLYSYDEARNGREAKDWDGLIIVSRKVDIIKLLNENRSRLCNMLSIVEEEYPSFYVPTQTHPLWDKFDAVRFVGRTANKIKKGVKVLSLEYFQKNKGSLNLLSFKDKRIFQSRNPQDPDFYRIVQQATTIDKNLAILHEKTVYSGSRRKCKHDHPYTSAVFGVTANLIVTSKCVYGRASTSLLVKRNLLTQFVAVSGKPPSVESLHQFNRFNSSYTKRLREEFANICPKFWTCDCSMVLDHYFYGPSSPFDREAYKLALLDASEPHNLSAICEFDAIPSSDKMSLRSPFSSNSKHGIAKISTATEVNGLFWKECPYENAEIQGSILAQLYYPRVQVPRIARTGELVYDWFQGSTQAELRFLYLNSTQKSPKDLDVLLFAELRKAEDTLRAWVVSLYEQKPNSSSLIHRFFYDRLRERRIETFYRDGVEIAGKRLPFKIFTEAPLMINCVEYPPLSILLKEAEDALCPDSFRGAGVFGLGDGHGGNVMIGSSILKNSSREILHIDYEVAGFHSPSLDIAKPLYNDLFFNIFYGDLLGHSPQSFCSFEQNMVKIHYELTLDSLSRVIMEIKRRYLFQTFCDIVKDDVLNLYSPENMRKLGFALLACSLLSRDFSGKWNIFYANLSLGVSLTRFKTLKEFEEYVLGTDKISFRGDCSICGSSRSKQST